MQGGVCFFGKSRKIKRVWGGRQQAARQGRFLRGGLFRAPKNFFWSVFMDPFSLKPQKMDKVFTSWNKVF